MKSTIKKSDGKVGLQFQEPTENEREQVEKLLKGKSQIYGLFMSIPEIGCVDMGNFMACLSPRGYTLGYYIEKGYIVDLKTGEKVTGTCIPMFLFRDVFPNNKWGAVCFKGKIFFYFDKDFLEEKGLEHYFF